MKTSRRIGMIGIFCLSVLSNYAYSVPNSSIDVTYNGTKLLDHYSVANAHKTVAILDNAKTTLETSFKDYILNENAITSVNYVNIADNVQLEFVGSNAGLVNVNISGISLASSGKGKESWNGISARFDWDIAVSDIEVTAQYSFITGQMTNVQLLNSYTVDANFDVGGVVGFFVDVFNAVGIFNAEHEFKLLMEAEIRNNLTTMFSDKFNGVSKTFFALDKIIPTSIIYQGQNIAPQIVNALVTPINGKTVTITADLGTSTNQTLTVNLWNAFIVTARRIKPVINRVSYEYNNCVGQNRSGTLSWTSTGSSSYYNLEQKSGSNWYAVYSGSGLQSYIDGFSGTRTFRVRSLRQGVQGEWRNTTVSNPSCSLGGGGGEIP